MNKKILKYSLAMGALYFLAISLAHMINLKVPLLFVYYDVPSNLYQDKIIGVAVIAYVILFFSAAKNTNLTPSAILALSTVVLGLSYINISNDLSQMLKTEQRIQYWLQTGFFMIYLIWISCVYWHVKKSD